MGSLGNLVTTVIVNYNGLGVVEKCVQSVFKSDKNIRVIVVDNGSDDGSSQSLNKLFSKNSHFQLIALKTNKGPAFARNKAVSKAKTKYMAFLDNDTQVTSGWLKQPVSLMEKDPKVASTQSKLVLAYDHQKLDYVGDYLSQFGFLIQRCQTGETDKGQYDNVVEILSAKSAGMFIRKSAFDEINGFDEDYFIYVEETDLGWRLWLAGYKNIFTPK